MISFQRCVNLFLDAVIMFWKLSETSTNPGNLFEEDEMENKENWVVSNVLR